MEIFKLFSGEEFNEESSPDKQKDVNCLGEVVLVPRQNVNLLRQKIEGKLSSIRYMSPKCDVALMKYT